MQPDHSFHHLKLDYYLGLICLYWIKIHEYGIHPKSCFLPKGLSVIHHQSISIGERYATRDKILEIRKTEAVSEKAKSVVMAITYSRNLPNIAKIVARRHLLLHKSDRLKQSFRRSAPKVAYRGRKRLHDLVVHDKLNKIEWVNRSGSCGKGCTMCQLMIVKTRFIGARSKSYGIKATMTATVRLYSFMYIKDYLEYKFKGSSIISTFNLVYQTYSFRWEGSMGKKRWFRTLSTF